MFVLVSSCWCPALSWQAKASMEGWFEFLHISFNQALDTRVHGFGSDFNILYKSKLDKIASLKIALSDVGNSWASSSTGIGLNVETARG